MKVIPYPGKEANPNRRLGDFPNFRSNAPVFSRRAVEGLKDSLEPNGELLPLAFSKADYFVYNITTLLDALDEEQSTIKRFSVGRVMDIFRFVFRPERVTSAAVFKLVQTPLHHPFVTDAFVERVRNLHLTGFEFKLVCEG